MAEKLTSSLIERSVKFEAAAELVTAHLRHILRRSQLLHPEVVPTRVSGRVKAIKSVLRKIARKKKDGLPITTTRGVEAQITDMAGARIVCDYLSDVAFIHAYLQGHPAFKVFKSKTEDYINKPKNGYRGIHLLVEVQTCFGRVKCEIQLRTMLQHAWAEKSHDLLYKLGKSDLSRIPLGIRNLMTEQSNFLYNMDTMALQIADEIRKSRKQGRK